MSLLLAIIVGVAIGTIAGFLLPENLDQMFMNILLGICGGIFGLVFFVLFLSSVDSTSLFNVPSLLTSVICALIFVLIFNGIHKIAPKRAAHVGDIEEGDGKDIKKLDKD
jgi:uncharacterized membrane protein YeaQ/YmgE (transglycosylase-associated protein family)